MTISSQNEEAAEASAVIPEASHQSKSQPNSYDSTCNALSNSKASQTDSSTSSSEASLEVYTQDTSKPSQLIEHVSIHPNFQSAAIWLSRVRYWRCPSIRVPPLKSSDDSHGQDDAFTCTDKFINQYKVGEFLGRGAYSKVRKIYDVLQENKPYALRYFLSYACKNKREARYYKSSVEMITAYDKVLDEILLTSVVDHPHICKLKEVYEDISKGYLFTVVEYLPFQCMKWNHQARIYTIPYDAIQSRENKPKEKNMLALYSEVGAKRIIRQLIAAVEYLHQLNVIHKDIKPDNIMLNESLAPQFVTYVHIADLKEANEPTVAGFLQPKEASEAAGNSFGSYAEGEGPIIFSTVSEQSDDEDDDTDTFLWQNTPLYPCDQRNKKAELLKEKALKRYGCVRTAICNYYGCPTTAPIQGMDTAQCPPQSHKAVDKDAKPFLMAKLIDFNTAALTTLPDCRIWDSEGTRQFTSPECFSPHLDEHGVKGKPRDLWSIGCTLYCLIFGRLPFSAKTSIETMCAITSVVPTLPSYRTISKDLEKLIFQLLEKDPEQRLSIDGLRTHSWIMRD